MLCLFVFFLFRSWFCFVFSDFNDERVQSSDDLDTDTEFEPVEDMTLETRSRCKVFCFSFYSPFEKGI